MTASFVPTVDPGRTVSGYLWDFGNGNTSTLEKPSASYVTAQSYSVSLTITYSDGTEVVTKPAFVEIFESPTVAFSADIRGGCTPLRVNFTDESTAPVGGNIVSRLWEFEGGVSANGVNEEITFTEEGRYDVTLYVETDNGCSASLSEVDFIIAEDQVAPSFLPTSTALTCEPTFTVDFSNTTPGTGGGNYNFFWDFGDGNTSNEVAPTHTYTTSGDFTVELTLAETESGCVGGTETRVDLVRLVDFEAGFSATPVSGCSPLTVQFTDTSSLQLTRHNVLWDFGDGSPIQVGFGTGAIRTPAHTYTAPGTYSVTLSVEDPSGACAGTSTVTNLITVPNSLSASFTPNESLFCEDNFTVNFTNSSTNATAYVWDFGDGGTSTYPNPSHTYTANGVYPVTLTATTADGCTDVFQDTIFSTPIIASFGTTNTDGCAPVVTDLINTSTSLLPLTTFSWEIRDQANVLVFSSTDENPIGVSLPVAGDYRVVFTAGNPRCSDTVVDTIQVGIRPISMDFVADQHVICNGEIVNFTNNTVEDPVNPFPSMYEWDYLNNGNLTPGTPRDGSFLYDNLDSGFYDVALYYESNGCVVQELRTDFIYINLPRALFTSATDLCSPDSLWLENTSLGADSFSWDILDDMGMLVLNNTTDTTLALSLTPGADYTVRLTATNNAAMCSDVFELPVTLPADLPLFGISVSEDSVCVDQSLTIGSSAIADSYSWTFTSDLTNITAGGDTVSPVFSLPGLYDIRLSLTIGGCTLDTLWEDAFRISDPLVIVGADTLQGCAPLTINFNDSSISKIPILSRLWTLNGDTISTDSAFSHVFPNARNPQTSSQEVFLTVTTVNNCTSTRSAFVRVTDPVAEIFVDSTFLCDGTELNLMANTADSVLFPASGAANTFVWSTNAPGVSLDSIASPNATFPNGIHTISLQVTDINGCKDSISTTVSVNRVLPEASFSADPTEVFCPPAAVSFFDESIAGNAGIARWNWTFGDNTTTEVEDPVRIFREPGVYWVELVIEDASGCLDTLRRENYIDIQGPSGSFEVDDTLGYVPLAVNFIGASPDDDVQYLWDFANGEVVGYLTDSTIKYTYETDGEYFPVMTVRDERGCDFAPDPVIGIEVLPCPTLDLGPDISRCANEGATIIEGYNATHDINLGRLFYRWNTGDTTSSIRAPVVLGTTEYVLQQWIIDDEGVRVCERSDTVLVSYSPTPVASFMVGNACLGEASILTSTSTLDTGNITNYRWDIDGDGVIDSAGDELSEFTHYYNVLGTLSPQLFVTSDSGCVDTATTLVTILEVPSVTLTSRDSCVGLPVSLTANVTLGPGQSILEYSWDTDGNGTADKVTADLPQTTAVQETAGEYVAILQLEAGNGCRTVDSVEYEVFALPELSFSPDPALLCAGTSIEIAATGAEEYLWEGGTTGAILVATPPQDTTWYQVLGTSDQGCVKEDSVQVFVLKNPFLLPEMRACEGDTLPLDASIPGVSALYEWSTGARDSVLLVTEPGTYSVVTEVTEAGLPCIISTTTEVIFDLPTPLPNLDTTVCFDDIPEVSLIPGVAGSYVWIPDGSTDDRLLVTQADTVSVMVTNARGCVSTSEIIVTENCIPRVVFPDAFSPNADGLNDVFLPTGQYFINYRVQIFNRWGEVIFISDDPDKGWNGLREDGLPHQVGVYAVVVRFESQFDPGVAITQRSRVLLQN